MDASTRQALLKINRRFYRYHAAAFSRSRQRGWPGWERLLPSFPQKVQSLLDVGCGNGRLAVWLTERGKQLELYRGIDGSAELLEQARHGLSPLIPEKLSEAVLSVQDVAQEPLLVGSRVFDCVALMAVLHHVPGREQRRRLLDECAAATAEGGILVASLWRWERAVGWERKLLSWEHYIQVSAATIDLTQLEAGDHLLTFGGDDTHPRYCHLIDDQETEELIATVETDSGGWSLRDRFDADGHSGVDNHYLVFSR